MNKTLVFLILVGALAIRLAAGYWWQQRLPAEVEFGFPDSASYWELARAIGQGAPYQMNPERRVFRTPGYPMVLAGLFWLAGGEPPIAWARALNAGLGVLAVGGVMVLARMLFDERAALLAGAIAAVYPEAVSMSVFVLSEALFCPLFVLHLIFWAWAWKASSRHGQATLALAGGLAAGLATLARPSWLLFTPFAIVVGLAGGLPRSKPASRQRHAWLGLWLLAGGALAMSPWWARNWAITGTFVPTTLQVGESLYDGLNPQATGASDMRFVDTFRQQLRAEDARQPASAKRASFEQRLDRRLRDAALAWARNHPSRVVALAGRKLVRMWNVWPNEPGLRNWAFRWVLVCTYVPVMLLGLEGCWRFAGRGWPYVLCFLPAVYFTCLHTVFIGSIRYRQPAMLPLIVMAAAFVGESINRFTASRRRARCRLGL